MTKYPKNGKQWTVMELKQIPPDWKGFELYDFGGLRGEVRVTKENKVSIKFRYGYKTIEGKSAFYQCGTFPTNSILEIRENRDKAKDLVKQKLDPKEFKKAEKIRSQNEIRETIKQSEEDTVKQLTIQDLYDAWLKDGVNRLDNNKTIIQTFEKHLLPVLGEKLVSELTDIDLRRLHRIIIDNNTPNAALALANDVAQMLNWAEKRKPWRTLMAEGNPADLFDKRADLPKNFSPIRKRKLIPEEIKKLNSIFKDMANNSKQINFQTTTQPGLSKTSQLVLWISLGTLCRIGEILMARWEHVDLEKKVWFIPKENTKGKRGQKEDLHVNLSDFVLDKFIKLKTITGESEWIYPARNKKNGHVCLKSVTKQVGDRQIKFKDRKELKKRVNSNVLVLGDEDWTPHDLRRTGASTMQKLGISRDVINKCQNHKISVSKVDRHYLLHDFIEEKCEAWNKLGNYLDDLLSGKLDEPTVKP